MNIRISREGSKIFRYLQSANGITTANTSSTCRKEQMILNYTIPLLRRRIAQPPSHRRAPATGPNHIYPAQAVLTFPKLHLHEDLRGHTYFASYTTSAIFPSYLSHQYQSSVSQSFLSLTHVVDPFHLSASSLTSHRSYILFASRSFLPPRLPSSTSTSTSTSRYNHPSSTPPYTHPQLTNYSPIHPSTLFDLDTLPSHSPQTRRSQSPLLHNDVSLSACPSLVTSYALLRQALAARPCNCARGKPDLPYR